MPPSTRAIARHWISLMSRCMARTSSTRSRKSTLPRRRGAPPPTRSWRSCVTCSKPKRAPESCAVLLSRQAQRHGEPTFSPRSQFHRTAVGFRNCIDDRQPQALTAARCSLRPGEGLHPRVDLRRVQLRPVGLHGDLRVSFHLCDREGRILAVGEPVAHHVLHRLAHKGGGGGHGDLLGCHRSHVFEMTYTK